MKTIRLLIAALVVLVSGHASAFYQGAEPPVGWTGNPNGLAGYNFSKKTGEAGVYAANGQMHVRTTAAVNVGGSRVPAPAALKFNAPGFFLAMKAFTPISIGMVALPFIIDWAMQANFTLETEPNGEKRWYKNQNTGWPMGTGLEYRASPMTNSWFPTIAAAGLAYQAQLRAQYPTQNYTYSHHTTADKRLHYTYNGGNFWTTYQQRAGGCPANTYVNPQGQCMAYGTQKVLATEQEFKDALGNMPIPAELPSKTDWDWPVEAPVINPDPYPTGQPAPYYIPTGQPYWDSASQTWKQPVVKVSPAPTVDNPWRVDISPVEIVLPTPAPIGQPGQPGYNPNPAPSPITSPKTDPLNPNGQPGAPITNISTTTTVVVNPNAPPAGSTETPKPDKQPLLCDAFPDILACAKLGQPPAPEPVPKETVNVQIDPVLFAGASGCPAPVHFAVFGTSHQISYETLCGKLQSLSGLFLAAAALLAAWIFTSGFRV